jgi:3-oxocholest-4-en-26-oate---CoA ligase
VVPLAPPASDDGRLKRPTFNLADLFESVADTVPNQMAMVAGDRRLTYEELDARATRLAHYLAEHGVGAGERIGLQLVNGTEFIEAMLACFKIRAVPININYRYVTDELSYLYENASLVGLVFSSAQSAAAREALEAMTERRVLLRVDDGSPPPTLGEDYEEALARCAETRDFPNRSPDDLYCVYTGGTTGMPKGVLWQHEDIFFAAMGGGDPFSLGDTIQAPEELSERVQRPGMTALPTSPFVHASAQWLAFTTLFGGGKVVTLPFGRFDPATTWRLVADEGVNTLVVVGDATARPLLDELEANPGVHDTSSLVAVGSGGALLSASTKRRLAVVLPNIVVVDAFGSSETGQLGGHAPADDPYGAPQLVVDDRTTVLDDELQPVLPGSGAIGHLARSGHIPLGYLGDPAKTASTFVTVGARRWSLPGDLATVAGDGSITIMGRGSLSINTGGEKVYPDEVERVLMDCDDIVDAVVVGVPDDRLGERVTAVVAPRPGCSVTVESVGRHCRPLLAGYKIPRAVVLTDTIQLPAAGKPDYTWARGAAVHALGGPGRA